MNRLALAALNSTIDDYESVTSVREQLAAFLGEPISEESLFAAFRALEAQGLLEAHRASVDGQALVRTAITDTDVPADIWFYATSAGRQLVDREWDKLFQSRRLEK